MEAMKLGMMDNPIAQNRFSQIRQEVAKNSGIQNYDAAGQQAIMEAINTGLYAGLDKPVRNFQNNADHVTPVQAHSMRMQDAQLALSAASNGMVSDGRGGWRYDPSKDPAMNRAAAKAASKSGGSGTERTSRLHGAIKVRATNKGNGDGDYAIGATWDVGEDAIKGYLGRSYGELTPEQKKVVDRAIGTDDRGGYEYYIVTEDAKGTGTGDDDLVIIRPKDTKTISSEEVDENAY